MNIENIIIKIVHYILHLLGINLIEDKMSINNKLKQKYNDL